MAVTATMGVYEELMFQFDDLGDLDPTGHPGNDDGSLSPSTEEHTNYILRHSKSDPMLTSPASREVMRSQQMAIAQRLVSLQACGQQRYLQGAGRGRHSIDEDYAGVQAAPGCRYELDDREDEREASANEDDELIEDELNIAPTIEQIKDDYNSCFSCGVSWSDNHVSLDCKECGGYALTRPCLNCDGKCSSLWTRNLAASHDHRQAQWEGRCTQRRPATMPAQTVLDRKSSKNLTKTDATSTLATQSQMSSAIAVLAENSNSSIAPPTAAAPLASAHIVQ